MHAARQLGRLLLRRIAQAHLIEQSLCLLARIGLAQTTQGAEVGQRVDDLDVAVQATVFGQVAHAVLVLDTRQTTEHADPAASRAHDVEDHAHRGGLA